jgi:hypothetical protein
MTNPAPWARPDSRRAAILLGVALLLGGCSPTELTCEPVGSGVQGILDDGMARPANTAGDAFAVQSQEAEKLVGYDVWFVAAEIDGPGAEGTGDVACG